MIELVVLSLLFAQTPSGWDDLIATYGPFAPFAALLLYLLKLLWDDNKAKEQEIRDLSNMAMEKIVPLVLEATNVLSEAVSALKDAQAQKQAGDQRIAELSESVRELHLLLKDEA